MAFMKRITHIMLTRKRGPQFKPVETIGRQNILEVFVSKLKKTVGKKMHDISFHPPFP